MIKIEDGPTETDIAEAQQTKIDEGTEEHASAEDNGNYSDQVSSYQ